MLIVGLVAAGGLGACALLWWYLTHTNWKGVPPLQFTLLNTLPEEAVVARITPTPGPPHHLRPGERITFTRTDPMYKGVTLLPDRGRPLLLGVHDRSGRSLGQILFTEAFLSESAGYTICLSAAADPPYVVDDTLAAYRSCPKPYPG
jgi:hypothetical protein